MSFAHKVCKLVLSAYSTQLLLLRPSGKCDKRRCASGMPLEARCGGGGSRFWQPCWIFRCCGHYGNLPAHPCKVCSKSQNLFSERCCAIAKPYLMSSQISHYICRNTVDKKRERLRRISAALDDADGVDVGHTMVQELEVGSLVGSTAATCCSSTLKRDISYNNLPVAVCAWLADQRKSFAHFRL